MPETRMSAAAAALAVLLLISSRSFAAEILPLKTDDATLLIGVDSARTSVVTVVAMPAPDPRQRPGDPVRRLVGTGVVLSPHRVLTTSSLALRGGTFNVLLGGGEKRAAHVKGVDRQSNVALFEVEGVALQPLRQALPQSIAIGSWVAVIANVNITRPQITLGRVVGRGERVDFPYSGEIVEIEASTYPGASGGAVLNETGEWVAIVVGRAGTASERSSGSAILGPTDGREEPTDLLVALPVDQLQRIAEDLDRFGSVRRAFLGIQLRRGGPVDTLGVLVEGVVAGSPAENAGLKAGDRVLALEGSVIRSADEMTSLVRTYRPDDEIEMTISRGSDIFPLRATLGAAVGAPPATPPPGRQAELNRLKRSLRKLEEETRKLEEQIKTLEAPAQIKTLEAPAHR
ncbi:MAG: trypsin-like peptidase domain-containing protein [Candidatus Latescibacteria bacterium]|nr:trypsin-like peptidase domain-containing protein [Candidatus Latescibacterota bacterium]